MFYHLRGIFPDVQPIRMSSEDVVKHCQNGLKRPVKYLKQLEQMLTEGIYPVFEDAIREILNLGVTIEQEGFLT